jgi:hypothetical protein
VRRCVAWIGPVCSEPTGGEGIKGYRTLDVRVEIIYQNRIGVIGGRNNAVGLELEGLKGWCFLFRFYGCVSKCGWGDGWCRVCS